MEHLFITTKDKGQGGIPLSPYVEGEDIETFLATFEKTMCLRETPVQEWMRCLVLLLTASTRAAHNEVDAATTYNEVDAATTYYEVKEVILSRLETTAVSSKIKLRENKISVER